MAYLSLGELGITLSSYARPYYNYKGQFVGYIEFSGDTFTQYYTDPSTGSLEKMWGSISKQQCKFIEYSGSKGPGYMCSLTTTIPAISTSKPSTVAPTSPAKAYPLYSQSRNIIAYISKASAIAEASPISVARSFPIYSVSTGGKMYLTRQAGEKIVPYQSGYMLTK